MRYWKVLESIDANFTKGKIYKSNKYGYKIIGDDGWVYDILPEEFLGIIFKEVKKDSFLSKIVRWFKNVKIM